MFGREHFDTLRCTLIKTTKGLDRGMFHLTHGNSGYDWSKGPPEIYKPGPWSKCARVCYAFFVAQTRNRLPFGFRKISIREIRAPDGTHFYVERDCHISATNELTKGHSNKHGVQKDQLDGLVTYTHTIKVGSPPSALVIVK